MFRHRQGVLLYACGKKYLYMSPRKLLFSSQSSRQPAPFSHLKLQAQEVRRKIYLATLSVGLLSVILVWAHYKRTYPFIETFYPLLMGVIVACIAALLWRRIPLHWVEYSLQTALSLFFLGKYAFVLQLPDSIVARSELNAVFWAMAFLIVIGYILVHRTIALWLAFGYILLTLILGYLSLLPERYPLFLEMLRLEIRLAMMALIAFILAKAKDDVIVMQGELLRMSTLANTDPLTALPNRRMLNQIMEEYMRIHFPFALLLIDIDRFKSINDTHGHDTGDMVLMRVAHTLRLHARREDLVSRWGGEEFLALIHAKQQTEILAIAERMRREVESLHFGSFSITISIGATIIREKESLESALKRADLALYEAKAAGKNCIRWQA